MDNNNNNQIENQNQNENENEMKNLEKKKRKKKENQKIQEKEKENQKLKSENEKKEKENKNKDKILKQKDEEIQNLKLSFEKEKQKIKEIQKEESNQNQNKLLKILPQFSNSEIIKDIEYVKKLQEWINDNDFFYKMKKGFSAKRDGFDCENWHKAVDGKGKTLVIIKTKDNFIFGGFTKVGWTKDKSKWREEDRNRNRNNDYGYIIDSNAFIFSLRNYKGDRKPEKFTIKKGKEEYAIYYDLNSGPFFGCDIELNSNLQNGYSNFGKSYNLPNGIEYRTNEAQSYLAGSFRWVVDELETYFI
ncbi:hypothetical protein M0811_08033 [Anaeramoeba ignava]|uniref:TLDc domain-containing protein n=1 Tax=Anaeramoeba ignava TaxID=1746090 RepID=A0A9Q0LNJ5_ANAIG|nr:hypothetical protein M0811_08033 [Anaeramoeba ignava]